jgi:thymidylate kinase
MLITFSGPDGSGKSTLVCALRSALEADGATVVVRHMNRGVGVYAAARALRDRIRGPGRPARATLEGAAQGTRWAALRRALVWNKPWRRIVYLADLVIFAAFRLYVVRVRRRILIMDRYFYDTLADVAGPRCWPWLRLLAWLTPRPDVAVLLATRPEEAYARKGEHSVAYLARQAAALERVFAWVPAAVVFEGVEVDAAAQQLAALIAARPAMAGRLSHPRTGSAAAGV